MKALERDKERLDKNHQQQEEAIAFVCPEDSQWNTQVLACKKKHDQLYRKCKSQEDTIVLLKGASENANALEEMISRMEEMKNKQERLTTRCTSQESKVVMLEK
jgi:hypothetical protein